MQKNLYLVDCFFCVVILSFKWLAKIEKREKKIIIMIFKNISRFASSEKASASTERVDFIVVGRIDQGRPTKNYDNLYH